MCFALSKTLKFHYVLGQPNKHVTLSVSVCMPIETKIDDVARISFFFKKNSRKYRINMEIHLIDCDLIGTI